jgi:hypothetical protein
MGGIAVIALQAGRPAQVFGQGAGVVVDAGGTLSVKTVPDPGGRLMKMRKEHAKAALATDVARPSKFRKFSLHRLEAEVERRLSAGAGLTEDMKYLAGLTRIQYVFCYPETGDIVLAGPAEGYMHDLTGRVVGIVSGRSTLLLEDLVVALRAYSPAGGRTGMIGCSIDPTKEGLSRMQQTLLRLGGRATPADTPFITNSLREALGLQTVSVFGVSDRTHFAQVLVEADYRMKLIGIGLEAPPVRITSYVAKANPSSVSRNALQRWYFVPNYDCVRVSDDEMAMEMVGEGVKLVGEDEVVTAGGVRAGSTRVDRASQAFVNNFTRQYPELAKKSPVYSQLRNLIDMAIAAAYIQDRDLYSHAGWEMRTFGDETVFPVEVYTAPKQVKTAVNAVWKGRTLMTPIGGGVHMRPAEALRAHRMLEDEDGSLNETHKTIDIEALEPGRWWWD